MNKKILIGVSLIVLGQHCVSQSIWQITLVDGRFLVGVTLLSVESDSLAVERGEEIVRIPVSDISEIRQIKESGIWRRMSLGAGVGAAVGATTAAIFWTGRLDFPFDGKRMNAALFGAVLGGTLGVGVGAIAEAKFGADAVYDLSAMSQNGKLAVLNKLLGSKSL